MNNAQPSADKAVVHISGTHLRQSWHGKQLVPCMIVRPSGADRDKIAYVVHQVKFDGPTEMIFSAKPRSKPHDACDTCGPARNPDGSVPTPTQGFVGTLPGFDEAVLVYLQASEKDIHVQASPGTQYLKFDEFRSQVSASRLAVETFDPMKFDAC